VQSASQNWIKTRISKDELCAWISIQAEPDHYPTIADISASLEKSNIVSGFDPENIRKLAEARQSVEDFLIANALPDNMTMNSIFTWYVPVFSPVEDNSDKLSKRVDFKNIKSFHPVKKDQILLSINSEFLGKSFLTVTGKKLQFDKIKLNSYAGRNTYFSENGYNLYSAKDGIAIFENNVLNVDNVYHVSGSVNYITGNIKFEGSVIIDGDVRSGFRVEARDDIFIAGNVEAAMIYSQSGNISIQCGIVGKSKAKILAGGSLTCGFIQDATVGVRKDVIAEHYIINSNITAGGRISVHRNEGLVRGGVIMAEQGIEANDIGSVKNMPTEIKLRNHSNNENQNRLWELSKIRTEIQMRLSLLQRQMTFLNLLEERQRYLSPQKIKDKTFIAEEISRLQDKLKEHDRLEITLQQEAAKERLAKEIKVFGVLFPSVNIDIGGISFFNDRKLEHVKILRFKDDILIESLNDMNSKSYDIYVQTVK